MMKVSTVITQFSTLFMLCICLLLNGVPSTTLANEGKIDLNTATPQQLQTLKGIGKALAKRIVQFRKEHGPFTTIQDIQKVSGIGKDTFSNLEHAVTIGTRHISDKTQ
ncbi:MAG: hypothetical protein GKS05_08020 [Nitrospirales bacterium]|nr:hypothetical protein [Nitrospirales bacterium]